MGILDSSNIPTDGKKVVRVRCDRIGNAGGRELWWVALAFADDTTKPAGMFGTLGEARELADALAAEWSVGVAVTEVA